MASNSSTKYAAEVSAYLELLQTHEALEADFVQLFKEHGLTGPQYNVLRILRGAGEPVQAQRIGGEMITRHPDVTRLVDRLISQGWATRERCGKDRRVVWVSITLKGRKLVDRLDKPVAALHKQQLGHMSATDLRKLISLLRQARAEEAD